MCGIAGIATRDGLAPGDAQLVNEMLVSLEHRGPDDQHRVADSHAAIGTRRLSIIDLATGRQPMANEDGTIWATQNGEIYNYVELAKDLEARGHTLRTQSDTETIVHLYEEFGNEFATHLRGMFAIAIWDSRNRRLVLARDRTGEKPLYWRLHDGRLSYGSELKALMADPQLERNVDPDALSLYLRYGYVPAPHTILRGVQKVPPASVLVWDGVVPPMVHCYWQLAYEPKSRLSHGEQREACLALLRESVRLQMRSDVPIGVFLSGGVDSSIVTALVAAESSQPVRTFSIGFEDPTYDELPYARAVAQRFNTDHTEEVVRLDAISLLPKLADHFDEPFADSSAIPTFRVSELAARNVKVVLTGDGGDEGFGGYRRYRFHLLMHRLDSFSPGPRREIAAAASRLAGWRMQRPQAKRRTERWRSFATLTPPHRYLRIMATTDGLVVDRLVAQATDRSLDYLLAVLETGPADQVDNVMRADLLTYLPGDLLVKTDRASMANSLETRSPFLDHKLLEFSAALPSRRKVTLMQTKVLLREVAAELLSGLVMDRPKMGFSVPIDDWFSGGLGDRYEEAVLSSDARVRDMLDQDRAAQLLRDHRSGDPSKGDRLWSILMLELWARRWLPKP